MILEKEPDKLLRATISNFKHAPDKAAIQRVRSSLASLEEMRSLRISEAEEALKQLARHESTLSSQHADSVSAHSATSHANAIVQLDTQKFRVAKAAQDLEAEGERLGSELEALRARLAELEMQGVEGDEQARERREADDPDVLKLKVFRSLGVDVETDARTGQRKAVIRSRRQGAGHSSGAGVDGDGGGQGDVHVVTIDPASAKSYYANYFWDIL